MLIIIDIYNLHGVVTSGGSRAFGDLYGVANETAFAVAKLEHLGAVIVGKTKTATWVVRQAGLNES
jgi:Asp-tRNA(Asn)/Glu-tRNA(Gln) amidotransferase A subunit family amidase